MSYLARAGATSGQALTTNSSSVLGRSRSAKGMLASSLCFIVSTGEEGCTAGAGAGSFGAADGPGAGGRLFLDVEAAAAIMLLSGDDCVAGAAASTLRRLRSGVCVCEKNDAAALRAGAVAAGAGAASMDRHESRCALSLAMGNDLAHEGHATVSAILRKREVMVTEVEGRWRKA